MRRKLYLSRIDKKLTGLCGGLAEYFGVDANILRVFAVVGCLFSFGTVLFLYIVCSLIVPKEPLTPEPLYHTGNPYL